MVSVSKNYDKEEKEEKELSSIHWIYSFFNSESAIILRKGVISKKNFHE